MLWSPLKKFHTAIFTSRASCLVTPLIFFAEVIGDQLLPSSKQDSRPEILWEFPIAVLTRLDLAWFPSPAKCYLSSGRNLTDCIIWKDMDGWVGGWHFDLTMVSKAKLICVVQKSALHQYFVHFTYSISVLAFFLAWILNQHILFFFSLLRSSAPLYLSRSI